MLALMLRLVRAIRRSEQAPPQANPEQQMDRNRLLIIEMGMQQWR